METDSKITNFGTSSYTSILNKPVENALSYNLDGPKIALLFMHKEFNADDDSQNNREFIHKDRQILENTLSNFGFEVECFVDKENKNTIIQEINKAIKRNPKCILLYFSTRGFNEVIGAKNEKFSMNRITDILRDAKELVGIPKIVFFQTTSRRANTEYDGVASSLSYRINKLPTHADMLVLKVNTEDQNPYETLQDGSIFVGALSDAFDRFSNELDLKNILVMANSLFLARRTERGCCNNMEDLMRVSDTHRKLVYRYTVMHH